MSVSPGSRRYLKDPSARDFQLARQGRLTDLEINGVRGFYGRVDLNTHIIYETLPSPGIAVLKMQADMRYDRLDDVNWDLPENLRPLEHGAGLPNRNLLGWWRAAKLTDDQTTAMEDALITQVTSQ